ncbi:MAG: hypothetical protein ABS98_02640 [Lysobacteraceae bacterium SCN 69-48]|nr:MAG: hypothetical protein ABS98_02640 [Xanthomonadaceae bacterium SCN 69-48]
MKSNRKEANSMPLVAVTSALDEAVDRHNERLRPVHYQTHLKVPGGPAYRCHLYISPLSAWF